MYHLFEGNTNLTQVALIINKKVKNINIYENLKAKDYGRSL